MRTHIAHLHVRHYGSYRLHAQMEGGGGDTYGTSGEDGGNGANGDGLLSILQVSRTVGPRHDAWEEEAGGGMSSVREFCLHYSHTH